MKVRIDMDKNLKENEVIIHCNKKDTNIYNLQKIITSLLNDKYTFYKNSKEYYINVDEILFFETSDNKIQAHTKDNVYNVKYKLYELEKFLPVQFIRVSKSTILNINHIYAIDKNLSSSSIVQFYKTYKQVYVSRKYYKALKRRLDERRKYET